MAGVQGTLQVRHRGHEEQRLTRGGCDHGSSLPRGVHPGLQVGASRHRGHGIYGDGPRGASAWPDGSAGAHLRRVRAGEGALSARSRALIFLFTCAPMLLGAQQPPPSRPPVQPVPAADSTKRSQAADTIPKSARRDTIAAQDSTKPDSAKRAAAIRRPPPDTIKTPTARPSTPRSTEIGPNRWHWDRDAMFASGALTLGELLARVPGVTLFTTGFILAPEVAGWYGNPNSVRVFVDGVERSEERRVGEE